MCSCPAVAQVIRCKLGSLAGPVVPSAVNLGVDGAAGRPIRAPRRQAKFHKRTGTFGLRVGRILRQKGVLRGHTRRILWTGALPSLTYGAAIHGVSDFVLKGIRRSIGKTLTRSSGGRSLTRALILAEDPSWHCSVAPILRWSKEIWSAQTRLYPHSFGIKDLKSYWGVVFPRHCPASWRSSCGFWGPCTYLWLVSSGPRSTSLLVLMTLATRCPSRPCRPPWWANSCARLSCATWRGTQDLVFGRMLALL